MTHATYTETRTIPLTDLTPYPGNARRGNVPLILNSLRRNAQYRSLIVRQHDDNTLTVLAGNHTLQALQVHGVGPCDDTSANPDSEQPCGICHGQPWSPSARCELITCDDNTAWRINLADNRTADIGDYDTEALTELLANHNDYDGTGYTEEDVQQLTAPPPDDVPDTADALADTTDTYREQYGVIIICADETEQEATYERLTNEGLNCRVVTT